MLRRTVWIETALFIAAIPFLLFPGRAALFGLLSLGVQAILRRKRTGHWLLRSSLTIAIGLIVAMALVGVAIAPDRALAFNRLCVLVLGVATFYTVAGLIDSEKEVTKAGVTVIFLGIAFAGLSLIVSDWSAGELVEDSRPTILNSIPLLLRLPGSGVPTELEGINPRLIAGTMTFLLPLSLALLLFGRGHKLRLFGGLSAVFFAFPLLLSQSPQGVLGVLLAMIFIFAWRFPWSLVPSLLFLLLASISWLQWRWWLPEALVDRLLVGINARFAIWPHAWQMVRDMPFTGVGLNNFPTVYRQYALNDFDWIPPHAHNIFLQTAVDFGILGLVAFLFLVFTAILLGWRADMGLSEPNARAVILGCVSGLIGFVGFGLWDTVTLGHKPAPALWAMLGILAASEQIVGEKTEARSFIQWRTKRWLIAGLLILVLVMTPLWGSAFFLNLGHIGWSQLESGTLESGYLSQHTIETFTRVAATLYPGNSRANYLLGLQAARSGNNEAAISKLQRAVDRDNVDYQAHFELAEVYDRVRERELAIYHYDAADASEILFLRGRQAERNGKDGQAEHWLELVTQLEPTSQKGWLALARAQKAQQAWDRAMNSYSEAISRFPNDTSAYAELGSMLLNQLKDPSKAREIIEQGIRLSNSPDPQLFYLRSKVAVSEDEFDLGEKYAQQAIELAPDRGLYLAWLGDLFKQQGRYEEALAQYELAAQEAANPMWHWKSLEKRGQVFVELGDLSEASAEFDRAVQIGLEQGADLASLAGNYLILGDRFLQEDDTHSAIHAFSEAKRYDPQNQKAADRLEELQVE